MAATPTNVAGTVTRLSNELLWHASSPRRANPVSPCRSTPPPHPGACYPVRAGPVSFTRFVCCNCYDRGPDWTHWTFFGSRRAAELHISRSPHCRAAAKGIKTVTQEYRDSRWAAGPVGAPGTWPARPAGMLHIAPDIGDAVCPGKTPDIGGCLCTYMNMAYSIS